MADHPYTKALHDILGALRGIREEIHSTSENQKTAKDKHKHDPLRVSIGASSSLPVTVREHYESEKSEKRWALWRKVRIGLEIGGFSGAVVAAIFTVKTFGQIERQANYAQGQITEAHNNFIADERAWLRVLADLAPKSMEGNAVNVRMKNFGKSVAQDVIVNAKFEIVDFDKPPKFELSGDLTRTYSGFIFPGDEPVTTVAIHRTENGYSGPTDDETRRLRAGTAYMTVYGIATYSDPVSPKAHWTRFCNWTLATDPNVLHYANAKECTEWNSFGDGNAPR